MTKKNNRHRKKQQLDPRWIVIGAVVLIVALVAVMMLMREDAESSDADAKVMADEFSLPDFTGERVALSDFRGQYVLVNFWASWCPPCKAEMPDIFAYYQQHQNDGFTVLAVNTNDDPASALDFVQQNGLTFPIVLDTTAAIYDRYSVHAYQQYGGTGLPTSFLIGPDGELLKVWRPGAISTSDLESVVTPLLRG